MWYALQIVIIVLITILDDNHDIRLGILVALGLTWSVSKIVDLLLAIWRGSFRLLKHHKASNRSRVHSAARPGLPRLVL